METDAGSMEEVSIDIIKKDIVQFQTLDPSSDEKSHLYRDIVTKLDFLESNDYWVEDITELRRILEKSYQKGFNIIYETSLDNFDDEINNTKAQLLSFNSAEALSLGEPVALVANDDLRIVGTQGSFMEVVNEDVRGTLVSYSLADDEVLEECTSNILRNGVYCFSSLDNVYSISKAGLEIVSTEAEFGFPSNIQDIGIFGKTNMYLLSDDDYLNAQGTYISRYTNIIGSQTKFNEGVDYSFPTGD